MRLLSGYFGRAFVAGAVCTILFAGGWAEESGDLAMPGSDTDQLQPKKLYQVPEGPWGHLEYYMAWLEVPDWYLDYLPMPSDKTRWEFPGLELGQVKYLLSEAGFDTSDESWNKQFLWSSVPGEGALLAPFESFVLGLKPEERTALSRVLQLYSSNFYFQNPIVIDSGDAAEWFSSCGLSAETISLISKLCYHRGETLLFSDVSFVLSKINSLEERKALLSAVHRTRTLVLQMKVDDSMDYEAVADYWTSGFKHKAILPLLKAVSETPGTERLDIAHLLPPTPRKLLYTFPDISDGMLGDLPDCHWTSFNFFTANPQPEMKNRILQNQMRERTIKIADGELKFGDILVLKDSTSGKVIHSVVYIAGDIVFTKNGMSMWSPWILMRYSDMMAMYSIDVTPQTIAYRRTH